MIESGANVPEVIRIGMVTLAIPFLMAFTIKVRKEIGARDNWHCQTEGCDKSFQAGDMVHGAHNPDRHNKNHPLYNDPSSGSIRCIDCHQEQHELGTTLGPDKDARAVQLLEATDRKTRWWLNQEYE